MTDVFRIDLVAAGANLDALIKTKCNSMAATQSYLVTTFVYGTQLILIFQARPEA